MIESGQFKHLNLPAIATQDETFELGLRRTYVRHKDDVLCPQREPHEVLERLRLEMGNFAFSAQYQQDPTPPRGNRVRWEWFGQYEPDEEFFREDYQYVAQSWDTGFSADPTSDFSVGLTWALKDDCWQLIDCCRARLAFPDLKRKVASLANRFKADVVLIEQAGSGISLYQQLRSDDPRHAYRYRAIPLPQFDKETRLEAQTAHLETGKYLVPMQAPWLDEFRKELLAFCRTTR